MIYMQEVLARPGENEKPFKEQEYWTLDLLDFSDDWRPHFVVQQYRGAWSEVDGRFMCGGNGSDYEVIETLDKAKKHYEARRAKLMAEGFIHSDLDF
jgi:hypothetical protein